MSEEGYIKFNCEWLKADSVSTDVILDINRWRDMLFSMNLIGVYDNRIGFGNISKRLDTKQFLITGSATGGIKQLTEQYYTTVTAFDFENNSLTCKGPIKASSESLTHAAVYVADPSANAIIHVHNLELWKKLLDKVPTTSANAAYGTPEMAREIFRLFRQTDVLKQKIVVMAGHKEGVITFGKDLEEAGNVLLEYFK